MQDLIFLNWNVIRDLLVPRVAFLSVGQKLLAGVPASPLSFCWPNLLHLQSKLCHIPYDAFLHSWLTSVCTQIFDFPLLTEKCNWASRFEFNNSPEDFGGWRVQQVKYLPCMFDPALIPGLWFPEPPLYMIPTWSPEPPQDWSLNTELWVSPEDHQVWSSLLYFLKKDIGDSAHKNMQVLNYLLLTVWFLQESI